MIPVFASESPAQADAHATDPVDVEEYNQSYYAADENRGDGSGIHFCAGDLETLRLLDGGCGGGRRGSNGVEKSGAGAIVLRLL